MCYYKIVFRHANGDTSCEKILANWYEIEERIKWLRAKQSKYVTSYYYGKIEKFED